MEMGDVSGKERGGYIHVEHECIRVLEVTLTVD